MGGEMGGKRDYTYISALSTATTYSPVKEILLHTVTDTKTELGGSTRQCTVLAVTSVSVVLRRVRTHQCLALLIPRCTLSACALEALRAVSAGLSIWRRDVGGAGSVGATTSLLRVALAGTGSTYCAGAGELAINAAVLVRGIADSTILEFTGRSVAAGIVIAVRGASAVAVFALFDNAIAALLAGYRCHTSIVGEAGT